MSAWRNKTQVAVLPTGRMLVMIKPIVQSEILCYAQL